MTVLLEIYLLLLSLSQNTVLGDPETQAPVANPHLIRLTQTRKIVTTASEVGKALHSMVASAGAHSI